MFVIEISVLVFSVIVLSGLSLGREARQHYRKERQAKEVSKALESLQGQKSEAAERAFGLPDEVLDGPSGRRLFIWKPSKRRSETTITVTIDEEDRVSQGSFRQRSTPRR